MSPRVWDVFMLRDELDMLQLRLEELSCTDCRHILVEAPIDHQGHPKPLHYAENKERFAPWADRITHIIADKLPEGGNPWLREHAQRDYAAQALAEGDPGDRVLIADIDEIPSLRALRAIPEPAAAFEQQVCAFAVDWLGHLERTSVMTTVAFTRIHRLSAIRDCRAAFPVVPAAGFHFCWLGGREKCLEKLDAFCHLEARAVVRQGVESGDFIDRGLWNVTKLRPAEVDERWPAMIRERRCPETWFRPRADFPRNPVPGGC